MTPRCPRSLSWIGILSLGLIAVTGCSNRSVVMGPPPGVNGGADVPLTILHASAGQTLALVPVYIDGQGPFTFTLDTGASHSLIEQGLADQLGLPVDGHTVKLSGISAVATGQQVWVGQWRVGDVELPARMLVTLNMGKFDKESGMQGLLGSDVLSQFGRVSIDYQNGKMTLGGCSVNTVP